MGKRIILDSVSKKYPFLKSRASSRDVFNDFWALQDVSFEVNSSEIVGIVGRNGSGKTTLLNIIAGVLSPTAGNIRQWQRKAHLTRCFRMNYGENIF